MDNDLLRRRAKKRLIAIVVLAAAGGLLYWYLPSSLPSLLSLPAKEPAGLHNSPASEQLGPEETVKQASLPPPPRKQASAPTTPPPAPASALTRAGIIANTNIQRKIDGGLPALLENKTLDAVAAARATDMFQKQYFAHVAPDGGSAETIAKTFGYEYLSIGENIALGIFAGDADLVKAWMESPGHRANILNTHFTQIGVAALKGTFEGKSTWIAVQVFGKPATACPSVDASLKDAVDKAAGQLAQMQAQIKSKKSELDAMEPKSGSAYNQAVDEYNALVRQYNVLLGNYKAQVSRYNAEVTAFNACLQAG